MCLPQGPWQETAVLEAAGPTEHIEGSLGMCVHVREKANSSCLRSGRPVLPGAQVCPHGRTRSSTHLRITRESPAALPHPADSLPAPRLCALLVPSVRQTRKPGHGGLRSRRCYLLGYQHRALGPEAQQLLRRGERQEGGDVCGGRRGQRGSWFLRDRWRRRHCRGPNPGPTPRTRGPPRARQGSVSRTLPPTRVQPPPVALAGPERAASAVGASHCPRTPSASP